MEVRLKPGKYILAVSGGVDSVTLLDLLSNLPDIELVVAHFNHGIRKEAASDARFVKKLVEKYGLPIEIGYGHLAEGASEETARQARYGFLDEVKRKHEAHAVVTAHHQDDLIETAFINILRGTGSRGLVAITTNENIIRPLIDVPKKDILRYAHKNRLEWVEDETNQDTRYLRNLVRSILAERLTEFERRKLLGHLDNLKKMEAEKDELLAGIGTHVFEDTQTIRRRPFIFLPNDVAGEMMLSFLRANKVPANRKAIDRMSIVIKTGRPGSLHDIDKHHRLRLSRDEAHLITTVR